MAYVPDRTDVVWISLRPQIGREQAGRRPALIMSSSDYNGRVGLCVLCPITNKQKGYAYEVLIPFGLSVTGVVMADQVKSVDWQGRDIEYIDRMPPAVVTEVFEFVVSLIET